MSSTENLIRSIELTELTSTVERIVAEIREAVEVAAHQHGVYHALDELFVQERVTLH